MTVEELVSQLNNLPPDAHVDAMFPDAPDAFAVVGVDTVTVAGGRVIAIIDITDGPMVGVA